MIVEKYFTKNIYDIEQNFDNEIRALTLIEYLKSKKDFTYSLSKKKYLEYYIAHPLIRQIVLNKDYLK